jgi:hypothetical protein
MSKKKQMPKFFASDESDEEKRKKEDAILENLYEQESFVFCLNLFSSQFKDWAATFDEIMSEAIAEKQKKNIPCEKEQKTLDRIKSLLALLSENSSLMHSFQDVISQKIEISKLLLEREPDTEMDMISRLLSKLSYFDGFFQNEVEMSDFVENITKTLQRKNRFKL